MFTKPTSCCLFINLRLATLALALLQTASFGYQSYFFYQIGQEEDFVAKIFSFGCLFLSLIGVYGAYGVYAKNLNLVKIFAKYYWYEFIGFLVGFVAYAVTALLYKDRFCAEFVEDVELFDLCHSDFLSVYLLTIGVFGISTIVRLHYCFSIWAYYRQLQTEQTLEVAYSAESKVVYPQYVYVSLDQKAPISESQQA